MNFQDTFTIDQEKIDLCPGLKSYSDISAKVALFLDCFKNKNDLKLHGETFDIRQSMGMPPLFAMDRAAVDLFGFLQYYVNVNGYVRNEDGSTSVWLQKRSLHKSRDPGKLDSFVSNHIKSTIV